MVNDKYGGGTIASDDTENTSSFDDMSDVPSLEENRAAAEERANAENGQEAEDTQETGDEQIAEQDQGGEQEQSAEKELDPRVESLAIPLARDYAEKNYPKREDGTFEPAWRGRDGEPEYKGKSPEDLMKEFGMSGEEAKESVIDIANEPYDKYSEHWKEANRGGAEFLISLLDEEGPDAILKLDLNDEATRLRYGELIHDSWLGRNEWVKDPNWGDPTLAQSFADLPPEEQQKDIDQLAILQAWLAEQKDIQQKIEHPEME